MSSYLHLKRLRKKLKVGIALNHKKDWKQGALFHWIEFPCFLVLFGVWLFLIYSIGYRDYSGADEIPIQEYTQPLPFATLSDIRPDGKFSYDHSLGLSNKITVKSDLIAPVAINLLEDGQIILKDGTVLDGGLMIEYYRAASPLFTREIFRELHARDKRAKKYQPLPLSLDGIEEGAAYSTIFPAVLLRKGQEVLYVSFYQTSDENYIPLEEWAAVFAGSLQG